MIVLPLLRHLNIVNYGLFPGSPLGTGIDFEIRNGVSLIAGINGLGKTTVLTVIMRLLTGPYDLSGSGLPAQVDSVTPEKPTRLRSDALRFFSQRVADDAREATATLRVSFQSTQLTITRELRTLRLIELSINGRSAIAGQDDPEQEFQHLISRLMKLSSFVDVLLVLHFIVFFPEHRPGALWDLNAQRHLLRAIFLPKATAAKVADLERKVGSTDSLVRNLGYALSIQEKQLKEAQRLHAAEPSLRAQLGSLHTLIDADTQRRTVFESRREELDSERRIVRLELERAKIEREDAERAVERIKFSALSSMFPSMPDAARLTILNLLSKSQCLVCGAHSERARIKLENELSHGVCPVCESPPENQENIIPVRKVEASRLKKTHQRAQLALSEELSTQARWSELNAAYDIVLQNLQELTDRIDDLQSQARAISAELPTPTHEMQQLDQMVKQLTRDVNAAAARRAEFATQLRLALKAVDKVIIRNSDRLAKKYSSYCKKLLSEQATLARIEGEAGIAQASEHFSVPLFRTDMSAAARPGLTRRLTAQDVSESQRELIDLAFRFALIEVATAGADATLVMETPEASLDGIAMERVGKALHSFACTRKNRLIATSNLSNAGLIGFLFGGPVKNQKKDMSDRRARTIDLLKVGAKNQALISDTKGRYGALLGRALEGHHVLS